ncbi:MAG: RHS repeat-associated core domain-containing protein, partial [Deltaproteobacteria bacterium]
KYDSKGNVVKELDALGYNAGSGETVQAKIDSGYGTEYAYNLAGKVLTVLDPVSKDRSLNYTTKYEYDGAGRKIAETNAKGVIKTYCYDDANNLSSLSIRKTINDPEQTIESSIYDLAGNKLSTTDGNQNTTVYEYNAFNKLRKTVLAGDESVPENTITYQYDSISNLKKQSDSQGVVNLYTHDSMNRQTSHTQQKADGSEAIITSIRYDKNGNKRFETDGNGNITIKTYDGLNRLQTVTNAVYQTTTYTYDANGNLLTTQDWRGNTFTNVYNPLNRLIKKEDPYGVSIQSLEYNDNGLQTRSYDALNNLTRYSYDKNSRLLETTNPEGHTTSQTYDDIGNIETKTDGRGKTTAYAYDEFSRLVSVTNAKNETTNYTYDLNGNMLTQTDAKGNATAYEYNPANKAKKMTDAKGKEETYSYNINGALVQKTDRNGITTTNEYDIHGRLISQQAEGISIQYTYDNNGNQLTMTDGTGTTQRIYDQINRVIEKTVPEIGTTGYEYDIIEGTGKVAERTTDSKNNTTKKVYDKAGRLYKVEADGETTIYSYYDNGRLEKVTYPNGSTEEYTYYEDNTLHTLVNKRSDQTEIESFSYTYDSANNQTSKTDARGITSYAYDDLERLETVSEPNRKVTEYTFDLAGNRATETVTQSVYDEVYGEAIGNIRVIQYYYDSLNRLLSTSTTIDGEQTEYVMFTYDDNGNQLSVNRSVYEDVYNQNTFTTINIFDNLNRLTRTETPEGKIVQNSYNGEGKRVSKTVDGEERRYLYEADKVILEVDADGNQKARNVVGTNLISRTVNDITGYYFYNGHGDTTTVAEAVYEDVLVSYYYDAFGNPETVQGSVYNSVYGSVYADRFDNPFLFAGYYWDSETGLYYLMARMYDPETARFLSEDERQYTKIDDPLSLNLYVYCHNEPIMYTDPDGHLEKNDIMMLTNKYQGDRFGKFAYESIIKATEKWSEYNNKIEGLKLGKNDKSYSTLVKLRDEQHNIAEGYRKEFAKVDWDYATKKYGKAWASKNVYEIWRPDYETRHATEIKAYQEEQKKKQSTIGYKIKSLINRNIEWQANNKANSIMDMTKINLKLLRANEHDPDYEAKLQMAIELAKQDVESYDIAMSMVGGIKNVAGKGVKNEVNAIAKSKLDDMIDSKILGTEKHHIATDKSKVFDFKNHPAFKESGINVSKDIDNLINLANHKGRHTNAYHQEVWDRLNVVYNKFSGTETLEKAVRSELNLMKNELANGSLNPYKK